MSDTIEIPTRTLIHAMVREDGTVDARELYPVAQALGMTDQQVRLCVARLVRDGTFTQEGRGRRALLRVTDAAERTRAPNVEFVRHAYRQDRGEVPWDGVWHLLGFAVPERDRAARDALRQAIGRYGGAAIQGGLYVSPNAWEPLIEAQARRLGVLEALTFATSSALRIGDERDPARLAARLWPLDEIAAGYERLSRVARPRLRRLERPAPLSSTEGLVMAMELVAEFTHALEPDPLLAPELLPQPWPGVAARAAAARVWARLRERFDATTAPQLFPAYADVLGEAAQSPAAP